MAASEKQLSAKAELSAKKLELSANSCLVTTLP